MASQVMGDAEDSSSSLELGRRSRMRRRWRWRIGSSVFEDGESDLQAIHRSSRCARVLLGIDGRMFPCVSSYRGTAWLCWWWLRPASMAAAYSGGWADSEVYGVGGHSGADLPGSLEPRSSRCRSRSEGRWRDPELDAASEGRPSFKWLSMQWSWMRLEGEGVGGLSRVIAAGFYQHVASVQWGVL